MRIRRGTTEIYNAGVFNRCNGSFQDQQTVPFAAQITDTPSAGTYTYYIETTFSGSEISVNEYANRILTITELKR